jgi:hypothetical protein
VNDVNEETQLRINQERSMFEKQKPVTQANVELYNQIVANIQSR